MKRTVLVIEDDYLNMKMMRGLLQIGDYAMLEATDAETGLQLAAEHHPDLILMDIQLPGLDGLSATRKLKENPELAGIPVLALTGLAMEGDRDKALEAGCTDYISKPINTRNLLDSLAALVNRAQADTAAVAPGSEPEGPVVNQKPYSRILVVDDDPKNVKLIEAILQKGGYDCINAYGGAEALAKTRRHKPDLILLDVMMPQINGYQVTKELKGQSATAGIPIIMITALKGKEDKERGLQCGADEFLTKPVNSAELLARVQSMLRLKQYRDQLTQRTHSEKGFGNETIKRPGVTVDKRRPSVLLVEDSAKDRRLLASHIEAQDCDVTLACDGEAALQRVMSGGVDLVLLDIFLPGIDGFEVCQRIKSHRETRDIQVVLITCLNDLEGKIKGMELGADDYLVKPVDPRELTARIKALLAKKAYLDQLHNHYEQALSSAISDGLTGLYNQTYFKTFLDLELKRSLRQDYPANLIMLDLDDFKHLNDRYGHPTGDRVLQRTAQAIRRSIRDVDLAARYGGEEFAVVLPYCDGAGAHAVARRILEAIRGMQLKVDSGEDLLTVTASIGIATCPDHACNAVELTQKADEMLYMAKHSGKNCIVQPKEG